jgi:UDP-N-acetyl-D-mannosaminuronate dehydrogenase
MENQEKTKEQQLQEAAKLLQQNKIERELAFQNELAELCKKYGVNISTQIIITAN